MIRGRIIFFTLAVLSGSALLVSFAGSTQATSYTLASSSSGICVTPSDLAVFIGDNVQSFSVDSTNQQVHVTVRNVSKSFSYTAGDGDQMCFPNTSLFLFMSS